MSSLRDRRVRIYGYENSGTAGMVSARYVFRAERWACVSQRGARKEIIGTAPVSKVDAVVDFDPNVDVRPDDLLVDGTERFFARGITLQRIPPARLVNAERIVEEVFTALEVVDPTAEDRLDDATLVDSVVES